jgi:hypothetical protein
MKAKKGQRGGAFPTTAFTYQAQSLPRFQGKRYAIHGTSQIAAGHRERHAQLSDI